MKNFDPVSKITMKNNWNEELIKGLLEIRATGKVRPKIIPQPFFWQKTKNELKKHKKKPRKKYICLIVVVSARGSYERC